MKAIFAAALMAPLLSGCFFIIPVGAINNAVVGTHCVRDTAKVGDTFIDAKSGDRVRITKLSKTEDGTPYQGCGKRLPQRAKVERADEDTLKVGDKQPMSQ